MQSDNKVPQLRCSAGFWHDLIRLLAIYWAQGNNYHAFSEPLGYGEYKPDLVLKRRKRYLKKAHTVFIEIQKDGGDKAWQKETIKRYHGKHLIIINPQDFNENDHIKVTEYLLSEQLALETNAKRRKKKKPLPRTPSPEKENDDPPGEQIIIVNGHRCKRKNANKYKTRV